MDLGNLDSDTAYGILLTINLLRCRLRHQEYALYSCELREHAMHHGIDVGLLRAMVELSTAPIPLPGADDDATRH